MRLHYVWAATLVLLASAFSAAFAQNLFPTPVFTGPVQTGNSQNQRLPEPILPVLPALGSGSDLQPGRRRSDTVHAAGRL